MFPSGATGLGRIGAVGGKIVQDAGFLQAHIQGAHTGIFANPRGRKGFKVESWGFLQFHHGRRRFSITIAIAVLVVVDVAALTIQDPANVANAREIWQVLVIEQKVLRRIQVARLHCRMGVDPVLGRPSLTADASGSGSGGMEAPHALLKLRGLIELGNVVAARRPHVSRCVRMGDGRKTSGTHVAALSLLSQLLLPNIAFSRGSQRQQSIGTILA
mmetsp:Transcript_7799/g.15402  ORF Transcript_7799/g.15402 Transcript_7799/m.15402 type:complete len:216 (-) Transcript_7799:80-727(-)